jgi:hypothetical protein
MGAMSAAQLFFYYLNQRKFRILSASSAPKALYHDDAGCQIEWKTPDAPVHT